MPCEKPQQPHLLNSADSPARYTPAALPKMSHHRSNSASTAPPSLKSSLGLAPQRSVSTHTNISDLDLNHACDCLETNSHVAAAGFPVKLRVPEDKPEISAHAALDNGCSSFELDSTAVTQARLTACDSYSLHRWLDEKSSEAPFPSQSKSEDLRTLDVHRGRSPTRDKNPDRKRDRRRSPPRRSTKESEDLLGSGAAMEGGAN